MDKVPGYETEDVEILPNAPKNLLKQMNELGYNSAYISSTMGSSYIFMFLTIFGLLIILATLPFKNLCCCLKVREWLKKHLLWNWVIRLVLEEILELGFCLSLQFKYGIFKGASGPTLIDMSFGILYGIIIILLPAFILFFYCKYFALFEEAAFKAKYGTVYEGLDTRKRSVIFYSLLFIVRRLLFVAVCLTLYNYQIIGLALVVYMTLISAAYLLVFSPYEEKLAENLDVMNEAVTVVLIDFCFLFTDLFPNTKSQYLVGYAFVTVMIANICVHLFFLFSEYVWQIKILCKRCLNKRQMQKAKQAL